MPIPADIRMLAEFLFISLFFYIFERLSPLPFSFPSQKSDTITAIKAVFSIADKMVSVLHLLPYYPPR